jgi:purine-cytosine permease-like protein
MEHSHVDNGIFGMIGTILFMMIHWFTQAEWAGIATIIAGFATGIYFLVKTYWIIRNKGREK